MKCIKMTKIFINFKKHPVIHDLILILKYFIIFYYSNKDDYYAIIFFSSRFFTLCLLHQHHLYLDSYHSFYVKSIHSSITLGNRATRLKKKFGNFSLQPYCIVAKFPFPKMTKSLNPIKCEDLSLNLHPTYDTITFLMDEEGLLTTHLK